MSITSRINEMSSHIEQAYDELQGLGADLTNVNKNIENISMVLDDIYDSLPSVSDEGTSLTLDDTRVGKIKSTLKGNTSQDGTPTPTTPIPVNVVSGDNEINVCGKNLLGFKNGTYTNNQGIIAIVDNGKITLNGTGTANPSGVTIPLTNTITIPSNDIYNLSAFNSSINSNISLRLQAIESANPYTNVTLSNTNANATIQANSQYKVDRLYIRCNQGTTLSDFIIQPQIEKSSSATEYGPYNEDTYNIDLPVENLLQCNIVSTTTGGVTITNNNDESFTLQGTATAGIGRDIHGEITLKAGTYTFSADYLPAGVYISLANVSNTILNKATPSRTFTISTDTTYAKCLLWIDSGYTVNDTIKIQLEKGSKQNNFTPYGTTPIELCKIGTYQDYFYKDSGKWYLHKEIGKVVLTPTNVDSYTSVTQGSLFRTIIAESVNGTTPYSNYFTGVSLSVERADGKFYFNYNASSNHNVFDFIDNRFTNVDDFKTFLTNNRVEVLFPIPTPTITQITYQPLIDQLNLLEKAMSKDGQTNISQVNNDLPFIITASALKEWSV